jgi:hypothetical protein
MAVTSSTKENALTPLRLAQSLAHTAVHTAVDTVRHPVAGASRAFGLARGAVHAARMAPGIVADTVATRTQGGPPTDVPATGRSDRETDRATDRQTDQAPDRATDRAPEAPGAGGVPDLTPPDPADRVRVVEEALAAESEQDRFGRTTEPSAASRDEEHGDATLQRAELDELAEEVAETGPAGQVDVETPAGTTGADVAFNPDTAEADLHQPRTEDLVDPATAKALRSEAARMRRAADPA